MFVVRLQLKKLSFVKGLCKSRFSKSEDVFPGAREKQWILRICVQGNMYVYKEQCDAHVVDFWYNNDFCALARIKRNDERLDEMDETLMKQFARSQKCFIHFIQPFTAV